MPCFGLSYTLAGAVIEVGSFDWSIGHTPVFLKLAVMLTGVAAFSKASRTIGGKSLRESVWPILIARAAEHSSW